MTACSMCGTPPPAVGEDIADGAASCESADVRRDADAVPAAASASLPLTWVTSVENGQRRVYCAACARTHLRAIEAKLDSAWW